jgi:hypothetical protein
MPEKRTAPLDPSYRELLGCHNCYHGSGTETPDGDIWGLVCLEPVGSGEVGVTYTMPSVKPGWCCDKYKPERKDTDGTS